MSNWREKKKAALSQKKHRGNNGTSAAKWGSNQVRKGGDGRTDELKKKTKGGD